MQGDLEILHQIKEKLALIEFEMYYAFTQSC